MKTRSIRHLPAPADSLGRVETGAVQFGDDWPGLFIRGDNCMAVHCGVMAIRHFKDRFAPAEWMMIEQAIGIFDCIPGDVHGSE